MAESALTYGQLDKTLMALGFSVRSVQGKARIYKHAGTGATVILPDSPFEAAVLPHHLVVVRTVLNEHDLVDPTDLARRFQQVS